MSVTLRSVSPLWRLIRSEQRKFGVLNISLCLSNTSLYPTCRLQLRKQALVFCKSKCINVEGSTDLSLRWKSLEACEDVSEYWAGPQSNAFWTESRARREQSSRRKEKTHYCFYHLRFYRDLRGLFNPQSDGQLHLSEFQVIICI